MSEMDGVRASLYELGVEASKAGNYERAHGLYRACMLLDEARLRERRQDQVSRINALLGVNLWDVRSFRADVRIDFDEHGGVYGCTLLNPDLTTQKAAPPPKG